MKKFSKPIVATVLAAAASTAGGWDITGNVAITSDYLFRGISRTDSDPALQGGLDAIHETGFYTGVWGSNVQSAGNLELDYYAGYKNSLNEQISFDTGVIYYDYPGGSLGGGVDAEYWEIYGGLSYDLAQAIISGKISYSPDYFGETGTGLYYEAGLNVPLPLELDLALHAGYQTIDDGEASKGGFFSSNEDSYSDWSIGITKKLAGAGFNITYSSTSLNRKDCGNTNICNDTLVFSISKGL